LIKALKQHPAVLHRPIVLAAQGKLTVVAQFTAALEAQVQKLYLSGGLAHYRSLLETENFGHPFANFVPNICNHTDLPEISASLGRRKIILAGMLDGGGRRMDSASVRKPYERCSSLEVSDQAAWTLEAIRKAALA
jgi:hypothetical protein